MTVVSMAYELDPTFSPGLPLAYGPVAVQPDGKIITVYSDSTDTLGNRIYKMARIYPLQSAR